MAGVGTAPHGLQFPMCFSYLHSFLLSIILHEKLSYPLVHFYGCITLYKPGSDSSLLKDFNTDIQYILDESKIEENVERINMAVRTATRGIIPTIVTPIDLREMGIAAFLTSYFNALWVIPFEKEQVGIFKTINGPQKVGYKKDKRGEIISILLQNGTKFIIFKAEEPENPSFLEWLFNLKPTHCSIFPTSAMLDSLEEEVIRLGMPKISLESDLDLKDILIHAGFEGLKQKLLTTLDVTKFCQKISIKTTLLGLEATSATIMGVAACTLPTIIIDQPYSIALMAPLPDGTHIPLFMGYIGDPTLSAIGGPIPSSFSSSYTTADPSQTTTSSSGSC